MVQYLITGQPDPFDCQTSGHHLIISGTVGAKILNAFGFQMVEHGRFKVPTVRKQNAKNEPNKMPAILFSFRMVGISLDRFKI